MIDLPWLMSLAVAVAARSKDPNEKVGCVIAGSHNEIISMGYNGLPVGVQNDLILDRDFKLKLGQHAERNALLFAPQERLMGATLVVTKAPCLQCAGGIIQAARIYGLLRVACPLLRHDSKWREESELAMQLLVANHVLVSWV